MVDAVERLVNLALFLAAARGPASAERVRAEVIGYPEGQDESAFLRMFERDKDELRGLGLVIEATPDGRYQLDAERTFVSGLDLAAEDEAALRAAAAVLLDDPSFPFAGDLRYALAKVSGTTDVDVPAAAHLADEHPEAQGETAATLATSAAARKRVTFVYTNTTGQSAPHSVEPYGLFLHAGRWYLVGRDTGRDEVRVYAVARMEDVTPNTARPRSADFERAADFDVSEYIGLPFQYGPGEVFDAVVRFAPPVTWRAPALTGGVGEMRSGGDGLLWHVTARDAAGLARWVIAHGPGLVIESPPEAVNLARSGLAGVVDEHA
ncbi:MAG: WYL domain-containing protein [Anaerosomatales bacterium]|nr:WYL domain-containing protein [Anaerosomatales bacterium]MDT8433747.1 WYL domain-containing protein [Anaerosomatales bacterium]